ncbi:MAG: STAS domain-containing protein [Leptospiraceae bacterium]|nr:STAS domain-containing protein [Leptospiraceae bacterium]
MSENQNMEVKFEDGDSGRVISLTGALVIHQAGRVHAQLLSALEYVGPCQVDLHAVTEIDTAGVQILIAILHEAKLRSQVITLTRFHPSILPALELFELTRYLGAVA